MSFSDFHAAWPLACAAAPTKDTRIENLKDRFDVICHGLRMPDEAFFHWNPKVLDLGRQIGQKDLGAFGVFSAEPIKDTKIENLEWISAALK